MKPFTKPESTAAWSGVLVSPAAERRRLDAAAEGGVR
jgi:hypothetical protein